MTPAPVAAVDGTGWTSPTEEPQAHEEGDRPPSGIGSAPGGAPHPATSCRCSSPDNAAQVDATHAARRDPPRRFAFHFADGVGNGDRRATAGNVIVTDRDKSSS